MKKTYVKPVVAFENFQMIANVASSTCVYTTPTSTNGVECYYTDKEGWTRFSESVGTNCFFKHSVDEFCYHVPGENNSVFGS